MARARHPMPPDVLAALKRSRLLADYEARPAYQRNDYIGWITRAARDETREQRITQMIDELRRGGVYMKMAHPASAKSAAETRCAVTRGEVDLDWYAQRDGVWRELGLSAPARRALVNAGILKTADLRRWTADDISALHGIGKTTLPKLQPFLKR